MYCIVSMLNWWLKKSFLTRWRYVTDVVLPLITKRCSMEKEEGVEELMESIIWTFGGIIWFSKVLFGSLGKESDLDKIIWFSCEIIWFSKISFGSFVQLSSNQESIIGIFRTNSVKWEREKEEGGVVPVRLSSSSRYGGGGWWYPPLITLDISCHVNNNDNIHFLLQHSAQFLLKMIFRCAPGWSCSPSSLLLAQPLLRQQHQIYPGGWKHRGR